jgi:hypothetical protein
VQEGPGFGFGQCRGHLETARGDRISPLGVIDMRNWSSMIVLLFVIAGCGSDSDEIARVPASPFVTDQRISYSDGLHNENTEMIKLGDRILLAFRGGEMGQTGSAKARIKIFESVDNGQSFSLVSEVNGPDDPASREGRDIRDPKFVKMGDTLFLYDISRLPGFAYRDLNGEAWTVRAESTDGGHTWTRPVKTYVDVGPQGETFWGFWRFTKRQYQVAGEMRETLFATGYNDGDTKVGLFASDDGIHWEKRGLILSHYDDVPSEAELQFFGDNNATAVALVRLDNQGVLEDGQTAICTSSDPFVTWECGRRIEQRLDGPTWVVRTDGTGVRNFVFARKHLPCTFKRTAVYELRGDLTDPSAAIEVCELQEVKSSGDTAYTSLVPLNQDEYLLSWYSSPVDQELPWLEGQFSPSDIWLATVHFTQASIECVHPQPKQACEPPALPPGTQVFDVSGQYLLTLAPVIWPAQPVFFTADVSVNGASLDFTLQPVDGTTKVPLGPAWEVTGIPIADDGSFTVDFGSRNLPGPAYPLINDPLLVLEDFTLTGKTTSMDTFCGNVTGDARVLPHNSDKLPLEGSTFGAARITGGTLPAPISSCQ